MNPLVNIIAKPLGSFLLLLAFLLVVGHLFSSLLTLYQHQKRLKVGICFLQALIWFALFILLLDLVKVGRNIVAPSSYLNLVATLGTFPWFILAMTESLSTGLLFLSLFKTFEDRRKRLLPSAIKDAIDYLPVGLAYLDEYDEVLLSNLRMMDVIRYALGVNLSHCPQIWEKITAIASDQHGQKLVKLTDGSAFLFSKEQLLLNGKVGYQLTATDVTDLYQTTTRLSEQNKRLKLVQDGMRAVSADVLDLALKKEMLEARIAVHDEVGHLLLRGANFLEHPDNSDGKVLLTMLKQTMNNFLYEDEETDNCSLAQAIQMARAIGVAVEIKGKMPRNDQFLTLVSQAIRESAANTVKHAHGNRIELIFTQDDQVWTMTIRNNGQVPTQSIEARGGLLSLQAAAQVAGASMVLEDQPVFSLKLRLDKCKDS